jgi:hypothetical protein
MRYIDWLRSGSEFHIVSLTSDGFSIKAAEEGEEGRECFHEIVEEARSRVVAEGCEIKPHRSSMDPKGRWDFAVITVRDE